MKVEMYAIKDRLNGFYNPLSIPNDDTALRYFQMMMGDNESMKIAPDDFSIWHIGTFDTETGMTEHDVHEVIRK